VLLGGGIYKALQRYFQTITDLALQHKMLHEFQLLGAPIPAELHSANQNWTWRFGPYRPPPEEWQPPYIVSENEPSRAGMAYDGELAAIFVMSLNAEGQLLYAPGMSDIPIDPDRDAALGAMQQGSDWRTITSESGSRVRLLTYRLTRSDGPSVLQLGRTQDDQKRVLWQILVYILILGSISAVAMGFGSWWLAGRSLIPAQQAWERQQTFIANASHELRAPLTLLRASAEVALRSTPKDDEDTRELLGDVLQECDHMNCLVEDLLLLSRLDAGRLDVKLEDVHLSELYSDIQRQVGRLAEQHQIHMSIEQTDYMVWGDPTHLRQIVLILLDNAISHTPADGTIALSTTSKGSLVEICVCDTGCGIAPEHVPHIFERFYRPDSTRTVQRSGAGLGLSIAKALVEAQQGTLTATSELGKGTHMRLTLMAVAQPQLDS
jgi:signal transduction histidine kinase